MEGVIPMADPKDRDGETFSPRCELSSTTPKNLALKNPLSSHHKTIRNSDESTRFVGVLSGASPEEVGTTECQGVRR